MAEIPWDLVPTMDAMLRAVDPRLTEAERREAARTAVEKPEFAFAALASVVQDYHARAERVAGLPEGTMVDRLRAKLVGDSEDVTLGVALATETPLPPAEAAGDGRNGSGRHEGTPGASNGSPGLSGRLPGDERLAREGADLAARIERTRQRFEREEPEAAALGAINGGAEQLARLGQQLRLARAEEVGAELEIDEQDEMAWEPTGGAAGQDNPWQDPWGGQGCGAATSHGPCKLRAGHPTGEGLPGERGHIGGMA